MARACIGPAIAAFLLIIASPPAPAGEPQSPEGSGTAEARKYIVEKYLGGVDPGDSSAGGAIEILTPAKDIQESAGAMEWEKGQIEKFAADKLFLLVKCPDGKIRSIVFRGGKARNERETDESRIRVLRRLYSGDSLKSPPSEPLASWLSRESVNPSELFESAVSCAAGFGGLALDAETVSRSRRNMFAEKTRTSALARALGALKETPRAAECCLAAVWLVAKMDKMAFLREQGAGSVDDLSAIDARTFFENVYFAVEARARFPWAAEVKYKDFLEFVLSPRATNEPLQRWRRHFFEALEPEVRGLDAGGADKARAVASNAYADYFQYEGATTWEDFGLLTSLLVHEGRCEDCSNVLNAMYWTLGFPACQAFTPWWGHCNGNHAWTWLRGRGEPPGDGRNGVKVYVKVWDGAEDVTSEYTPVTSIKVEAAGEGQAELCVWNHEEWRRVARARVKDGFALFENVGCRLHFALLVKVPGGEARLADVRPGGAVSWMSVSADDPADGKSFEAVLDKISPIGEFSPDSEYSLQAWTASGWKDVPSTRHPTGSVAFAARADRLYMMKGKGMTDRPFTVEKAEGSGEILVTKR